MDKRRFWVWAVIAILLVVIIKVYSANKLFIEEHYATGIYPGFAAFLRLLFGWLPFSIGDFLYGGLVAWGIYKLVKAIFALFKKRVTRKSFLKGLVKLVGVFLLLYIIFNSFWGINYNRKGIAFQLGLPMEKYSLAELKGLNLLLLQKVNSCKKSLVINAVAYPNSAQLFTSVQQNYIAIDSVFPFLQYKNRSIKTSMWGWLGNYTGFTGYYNPFTGEAQVNTTIPKFLQPFTASHEVAHQLGYAKENEANFVGYLAASTSADTLFQYSTYLDMFLYSNRNLFISDSSSANLFSKQLSPDVKKDLLEWRIFNKNHQSVFEKPVRWMYGKFLQSNEQPQGVLSYDAVTSFLIAYYKKYGKI